MKGQRRHRLVDGFWEANGEGLLETAGSGKSTGKWLLVETPAEKERWEWRFDQRPKFEGLTGKKKRRSRR